MPHYFDTDPAAESEPRLVRLSLPDMNLALTSDRGVFAADQVDRGTYHLLREAPPPPAFGDVLDLGCGYGVIALCIARRAPSARVWAIDVNQRALALTRMNALTEAIANVSVCTSEDVPLSVRFSAIYSNPPVRIGKEALHTLLGHWLDRLDSLGHAYLVVQRHLGADSLGRWLEVRGHRVERFGSKGGYRLLDVTARAINPRDVS